MNHSQLIADRIRNTLILKGITQSGLGARMNLNHSTITNWLSGNYNFSLLTINKIEKALNIKLIEVIRG